VEYSIEIERKALDFLKSLPVKHKRQVSKKIESLRTNPYPPGSRQIKGQEAFWRIRSGDYRIAYTVRESRLLVLVVHIGDRKDFYRFFN